jgi:hypothetical protein
VHPDPAYRMTALVLELRDERSTYLVAPRLAESITAEAHAVELFTAITRQGTVFLWPVKLPTAEGRRNEWNASALEAASLAMTRWIRVAANMSAGAYDVHYAASEIDEPEWLDVPFADLVKLAFKYKFIDSLEHPVLRQLRGEA